jgi:hypothetical protein
MLCETCRYTKQPGFVRARLRAASEGADDIIPCPDCGGQGIAHCCDGICEQPDAGADALAAMPPLPNGPKPSAPR